MGGSWLGCWGVGISLVCYSGRLMDDGSLSNELQQISSYKIRLNDSMPGICMLIFPGGFSSFGVRMSYFLERLYVRHFTLPGCPACLPVHHRLTEPGPRSRRRNPHSRPTSPLPRSLQAEAKRRQRAEERRHDAASEFAEIGLWGGA